MISDTVLYHALDYRTPLKQKGGTNIETKEYESI